MLCLEEVRFYLSNVFMTTNETILAFLIDRTNWNDKETVDYCFELAFKLDLSHMVDNILDRMNAAKTRENSYSEVSW